MANRAKSFREKIQDAGTSLGRKMDPIPAAIPIGFDRPPSLQDEIKRFVRQELSV